jgi:hypothetical protein
MIWAAELVIGDPAVAPGFIPIFAVHERNRPPRPAARWLLDRSLPDRPTMQSSAMSRARCSAGIAAGGSSTAHVLPIASRDANSSRPTRVWLCSDRRIICHQCNAPWGRGVCQRAWRCRSRPSHRNRQRSWPKSAFGDKTRPFLTRKGSSEQYSSHSLAALELQAAITLLHGRRPLTR